MQIITQKNGRVGKYEDALIDCYMQVFAAPPWNEDWWTPTLVREVLTQYSGPNVTYVFAVHDEEVVGFVWGAYMHTHELIKDLCLNLPYSSNQLVGYLKDVGVRSGYRQIGLAKRMLQELIESLKCDVSAGPFLARTLALPEPSVVYQWFPALGFTVVAHYTQEHERYGQVILGMNNINDISF